MKLQLEIYNRVFGKVFLSLTLLLAISMTCMTLSRLKIGGSGESQKNKKDTSVLALLPDHGNTLYIVLSHTVDPNASSNFTLCGFLL